jgi:uncharacterized protein YkwD
MKTYPYLKVTVVACIGAFASCAPPPETQRLPVSGSLRPDSSLTGRIHSEVTSYRRSRGASELQRHAGLDRLAQEHCEYLRRNKGSFGLYGKNVSHFGFEGRAIVARERYQMMSISENVAATFNAAGHPAPAIVSLWINSKDHEYNMRSRWTHTGIGAVTDSDGTVFATQLFSTISYSQLTTRNRFSSF